MSNDLHKCETPDCLRLVSPGSAHCCTACTLAAAGKYEIHESGPLGHSQWCDERAAERGPWLTPAQALEKAIDEARRSGIREFAALEDASDNFGRVVWLDNQG